MRKFKVLEIYCDMRIVRSIFDYDNFERNFQSWIHRYAILNKIRRFVIQFPLSRVFKETIVCDPTRKIYAYLNLFVIIRKA